MGCKVGVITIRENYRGVDYVLQTEEGMTYDEAALALQRLRSDQHFLIDQAAIAFGDIPKEDTDAKS